MQSDRGCNLVIEERENAKRYVSGCNGCNVEWQFYGLHHPPAYHSCSPHNAQQMQPTQHTHKTHNLNTPPTWMSPLLKYSSQIVAISFLYATTSSRMRELLVCRFVGDRGGGGSEGFNQKQWNRSHAVYKEIQHPRITLITPDHTRSHQALISLTCSTTARSSSLS